MEYQALYRKYRPQRFDQVIGQDHVTNILSREIIEGRVAHAYLFAGPRGTGKTTTARLLAKSLNCPDQDAKGEPCDACSSCVAVATSSSLDVLELDAASHNKVEDIRDLKASVSTVASVGGARRVFILDEAHMLTKSASNALLKTLEEPPDQVHFVLATTEPYRLLDTIRSRSQRFDFLPISAELIAGHLEAICASEGYRASSAALMSVARRAAGSVRDALSLLEQVAALDGSVTPQGISHALGVAGGDAMAALMDALINSNAKLALELIAGLAERGVDLRRFAGDAIAFFRGVFLTMYSPNVQDITDEPSEVVTVWKESSEQLTPSTVMRAIDLLSDALVKLREGREERIMLELAILKLVKPELDTGADALLNRLERLEKRVSVLQSQPRISDSPAEVQAAPQLHGEQLKQRVPARPVPEESAAAEPAGVSAPAPEPSETPAGGPPTAADLDRIWPQLVADVREHLGVIKSAVFRETILEEVDGSTLVFKIPNGLGFHYQKLSADLELQKYLTDRGQELLGIPVEISFRISDTPAPAKNPGIAEEPPTNPLPDISTSREKPADTNEVLSLLEQTLGARVVEED